MITLLTMITLGAFLPNYPEFYNMWLSSSQSSLKKYLSIPKGGVTKVLTLSVHCDHEYAANRVAARCSLAIY